MRSRKTSKELRKKLLQEQENKCACCGSEFNLTLDHIIPISKGGSLSNKRNRQILCQWCNQIKGDLVISLEELRAMANRSKPNTFEVFQHDGSWYWWFFNRAHKAILKGLVYPSRSTALIGIARVIHAIENGCEITSSGHRLVLRSPKGRRLAWSEEVGVQSMRDQLMAAIGKIRINENK